MKYYFLLLTFLFCIGCGKTDCSKIPGSFKSYNEAESFISSANFGFTDDVNTSNSSWIRGAKYYSCDKQTGFFILETDKQHYIHQNLPIVIWNGFKNAQSFGGYYNRFIKHRFQIVIAK